jgi:formylglycine-generating enzyme required for sulfatase activity
MFVGIASCSNEPTRPNAPPGMVLVPEGSFVMGQNEGKDNPEHTVWLDAYHIDIFEVTNRQYKLFLDDIRATGDHSRRHPEESTDKDHTPFVATTPRDLLPPDAYERGSEYDYDCTAYNWRNGTFPPGTEDHPVVLVDWFDAFAYAALAGKRLPTEAEWEKAARGTTGGLYPWGQNPDPNRCNMAEHVLGIERFELEHFKNLEQLIFAEPSLSSRLLPVGSFEDTKSPFGCFDMVGNAWEWVADFYSEDYYPSSPGKNPHGPRTGAYRVCRGGGWTYPLVLTTFNPTMFRGWEVPQIKDLNTGFRCAMDVESRRR